MKIEQIQYFVEVAKKGSISAAAKSMFMSPQGVSDAIHQLENLIGFPLFIRQNKGVILTAQGKIFLEKAEFLLETYQATLACAQQLKTEYNQNSMNLTLLVNPMFFKAAIDILYDSNLDSPYNIFESGIASSLSALQSRNAHLAILVITYSEINSFKKNLPVELSAVELFEDTFGACTLPQSPYAHLTTIDDDDANILYIEHPSSYYEYFNNTIGSLSKLKTGDLLTHQKMMQENNAVCITTRKLMNLTYPKELDLKFIPFTKERTGTFFLVYNNLLTDKRIMHVINQLTKTLRQTLG